MSLTTDCKNVKIYKTEDGKVTFKVNIEDNTVWLNRNQMSDLFDRDIKTIGKHINNIFSEEELVKDSVVANFATTATDGKIYNTQFYNLDVIISVGYRVKSKRGTQFRQWASSILKDYLIKGYALNEKKLEQNKLNKILQIVNLASNTINNEVHTLDEAKGIFKVITDYTYALTILDEYDHQYIKKRETTNREAYLLTYNEAIEVINSMKDKFSTDLFGFEKDESFKGSLGAIYQTAFGNDVYPSIEEKAANLLYFVVKNHSFTDGNKRIAAAIFIHFMNKNNLLYNDDKTKRIADNTLVAITLLIAESRPEEKDIITQVLVNLINSNN
ncbi:MAG: virulence protein RhuM/Fic/DOC family protein [Spirochaetales bacterium]|nr:virulence protein RhuM/Fic/DOC family protein [Spirochaetales bacterium]